jgi:hypothetical protein
MRLLLLSALLSQSVFSKVYIYQQWHLLAKVKSLDIEESKKLKQYENQKFIYQHLDQLIKSKKVTTLFSEGCEGEIDKNFSLTFNGWNYQRLEKQKKNFDDIMTLIPLKLEVKYKDKLKTYCGDNLELIQKHGLAFSDIRGYYGYYLRFKQYRSKPEKAKIYLKALEETEKKKIKDPLSFSRNMAKHKIGETKNYIKLRNDIFIKHIKSKAPKNSAVILGALHLDDLMSKLKKEKIDFEVVDVKGLPANSKEMLLKLEKGLR